MNANDIMMYGNRTLLATLARVPEMEWDRPDVCGYWSVRQIVSHLASHELAMGELLAGFAGEGEQTPTLDEMTRDPMLFNDAQVAARAHFTPAEALAEYEAANSEARRLAALIPAELFRRPGTIPWYGVEYALDDLIVYGNYGHKREHSAQVAVFSDLLAAEVTKGGA